MDKWLYSKEAPQPLLAQIFIQQLDRFVTTAVIRGGAVYTISRSTDTPSGQGFGYSLKFDNAQQQMQVLPANDFTLLEQRIEGQNLQHLLKGLYFKCKKTYIKFLDKVKCYWNIYS